jgi:hypothetical protein
MSAEPALLADGQVVLAGKSRIAYLLDGGHLGGVGGQLATLGGLCDEDVDGGVATVGTTVYLPCLVGPVALQTTAAPAGLRLVWSARIGGGPPVVVAGRVWTIGQDGTLYGLAPATGAVVQRATVGVPANHFPTPGVGAGLLLVPAADQVVAFAAPSPSSPAVVTTVPSTASTTPATTTHPAAGAAAPSAGGLPAGAWAALAAAAVLLGVAAWLVRRRGTRSQGTRSTGG